MYADDGKIFFKVREDADHAKLKSDIENVFAWLTDSQLNLALHKCEVLHLGRSNPCRTLSIGGNDFINVQNVKDLGVHISQDLYKTILPY